MFLVAGLVEGVFRQIVHDVPCASWWPRRAPWPGRSILHRRPRGRTAAAPAEAGRSRGRDPGGRAPAVRRRPGGRPGGGFRDRLRGDRGRLCWRCSFLCARPGGTASGHRAWRSAWWRSSCCGTSTSRGSSAVRPGATPGKRLLGVRVIDAHGGMLTAEAVFARNFMREIELFLAPGRGPRPRRALARPARLGSRLGLGSGSSCSPCCPSSIAITCARRPRGRHPRRARSEDGAAGGPRLRQRATPEAPARSTFTGAQLDLYGIRELQVLESLLRQETRRRGALEAVARKIQHKIGWVPPPERRSTTRSSCARSTPPSGPVSSTECCSASGGRPRSGGAHSKTLSSSSTSTPSLPTRRS